MKSRVLTALLIAALGVAVTVAVMFGRVERWHYTVTASSSTPARQALSNSMEFVKDRITGGVGVALTIDSNTKLPMVGAVAIGSPAHEAGLHTQDVITRVGGITTTGAPLKQVVDTFRGFTGASVPIAVLRGTNHLDFVIRRTSLNKLRQKQFSSSSYE